MVLIRIADLKTKKAAPWPGRLLLCGGIDEAGFLPPAVFADRHALAPFRKLDEPGALTVSD
jgi:hypothetical protein